MRYSIKNGIVTCLLLITGFSCREYVYSGNENEQIATFISRNNYSVGDSIRGGLKIVYLRRSPQGMQSQKGKRVEIDYITRLLSGKVVDRGVQSFTLGANSQIRGIELGVERIRTGERAYLIFPSSLGYGNKSVGEIPPNSPLVAEVGLISIQ
ncbi:MAG: FKBP-type peptidyl-prolyl cis-trans isomerase [Leadbetterella sp.]